MSTTAFKLASAYTPAKGDFLCLPYIDGKTPAYPKTLAPKTKMAIKVPEEAGSSALWWFGKAGDPLVENHATQIFRLDGQHVSGTLQAATMVSTALAKAKELDCARVVVLLDAARGDLCRAVQEGALLGGYAFDKYLTKKKGKKKKPIPVTLVAKGKGESKLKKMLAGERAVLECVNFARDVLNEPPSTIKPPKLADEFNAMGKKSGLKVEVWDEKKLSREKCGGILGVGQGSTAKPRLVIGEYRPKGAKKHLCLVGKGVTFDSGGYCLKPSESQVGMKYDMGGAAMMFAAACAIARRKLKIRVTVLTPLAENTIDGGAYMTTSILRIRNGTTVEVHNTDAEGRLILADALTIAGERKPDWIIDAATLTGACVVALGEDIAGAFGTDPAFTQTILQAGRHADEQFWELPLHMPYAEQLKTTIADCKNIGKKWGGSITAALFLKQFVPDDLPWAHLDIAGPGIKEEPCAHLGKGAKGFGVKTAVRLATMLAKSS